MTNRTAWKLTSAQKRDALRRYRAGEKVGSIAASLGVCGSAISMLAGRAGLPPRRSLKPKKE